MQDDNNSWDIMQDLEFLIASDCQLKDELDHVCDLLDSDSSPDELTPPTAAATASDKKKRRSRNNRYKQDILQLRAQVESLKEELLKARANTSTADMSVWELAARRERMESLRSQMENQDLRAAVEERASFIDNMKRLLCKKPRWISPRGVVADDCEWQSYKLAAHQSLRIAAIHAIADRQYHRQNSAFIHSGVLDYSEDTAQAMPARNPQSGQSLLQIIYVVNLSAPHRDVGSACWNTLSECQMPLTTVNADKTVERIDDFTVYERYNHALGETTRHSNSIRKHYPCADRDVMVWRTVLEDALVPHMSKCTVDDSWGWMVVSPNQSDSSKCRLYCLFQSPLASLVDDVKDEEESMDQLVAMVNSLSLTTRDNAKSYDATSISCPSLRAILERGHDFEKKLKSALIQVERASNSCSKRELQDD
ncbi:hypothetical protein AeRB84_017166 [Aphanomyces euteiches]|nr:hypothetical protein AeRB84_017166 [Aphanomyces euteiches]